MSEFGLITEKSSDWCSPPLRTQTRLIESWCESVEITFPLLNKQADVLSRVSFAVLKGTCASSKLFSQHFPRENKFKPLATSRGYALTFTRANCVWVCMRSLSTLLGTPAHLLIHAVISSANRVAAAQRIKSRRYGSGASVYVHINRQNVSDFDRGMIIGARQGGLSISETADLQGFSRTTVSRVCREWSDKTLNIQWAAVLRAKNVLLMREVRGEGPDCSKLTGRWQ